ncbi:MAG: nucleoside transporter C-terminal domain-containing protein [Pseudomonadota bacterium]
MSIVGIVALLAIAVAFSTSRRHINLRIVVSAFLLQALVAVCTLYLPIGVRTIEGMSRGVRAVIGYSRAGIDMVFGALVPPADSIGSFAVTVLPVVIFFASLMGVLYYLGIAQFFVRVFGAAIRAIVGTRSIESLNAAGNIFIGMTESPLIVKPYLARLSDAQIFTVMVSGMASIAGTVLAAYAGMGAKLEYLLAASFMAAPGGLLMAKLMMPDPTEATRDAADDRLTLDDEREANVILAAANGAAEGLKLAANIGAMLIAFVALIALLNGLIGGVGSLIGVADLTLEKILGWVFSPLMFLLSVPWEEAQQAGALFGEKLILNEFVAFFHFGQIAADLSPRTQAIVTFSLCGFANLSSIAIMLGGLGILIPEKRELIGRFGLRALLAASLSNLMSAALAGMILSS